MVVVFLDCAKTRGFVLYLAEDKKKQCMGKLYPFMVFSGSVYCVSRFMHAIGEMSWYQL